MEFKILSGMAILFTLGLIAVVLTSGNLTGAFFADKAASTSNTFTAGVGCPLIRYSGTNDIVGETGSNAIPVTPDSRWSASIPGATWVWGTSPVDPLLDQNFTFKRTFYWSGTVDTATLQIAADNLYWVYLNGNLIATSPNDQTFLTAQAIDLAGSGIQEGTNTLEIKAENIPNTANPTDNPAGLLYKLSIYSTNCISFGKVN